MRYTLWHTESGNLVGDFESEAAALGAASDVASHTRDGYDDLVIEVDSEHGPEVVATGSALAHRIATAKTLTRAAGRGMSVKAAKPLRPVNKIEARAPKRPRSVR